MDRLLLLVSCEPVKGDSREAAVGEFSRTANSSKKYQLRPVVGGGVRWSPAYEDLSPEPEERLPWKLLPSSVIENTSLCVIGIYKV
jgi:hypothetical protein